MIATHDDVQQSAVNVNIQPVHAVGGAMVSFLKKTDEKQFPVLLDNQSQISILYHSLLSNVTPLEQPALVTGIGGNGIKIANQRHACRIRHRMLCSV